MRIPAAIEASLRRVAILILASLAHGQEHNRVDRQQEGKEIPGFVTHSAQQDNEHWCWAACIQSVLVTLGYEVSQESIVQATFGDSSDRGVSLPQLKDALQNTLVPRGVSFQIPPQTLDSAEYISQIDRGNIVLA